MASHRPVATDNIGSMSVRFSIGLGQSLWRILNKKLRTGNFKAILPTTKPRMARFPTCIGSRVVRFIIRTGETITLGTLTVEKYKRPPWASIS